jgi:hypothetical protein
MHEGKVNAYNILVGIFQGEKDRLENLGVDGRKILK